MTCLNGFCELGNLRNHSPCSFAEEWWLMTLCRSITIFCLPAQWRYAWARMFLAITAPNFARDSTCIWWQLAWVAEEMGGRARSYPKGALVVGFGSGSRLGVMLRGVDGSGIESLLALRSGCAWGGACQPCVALGDGRAARGHDLPCGRCFLLRFASGGPLPLGWARRVFAG